MKRLLAVLGVIALLATLFTLATSSPSAAQPSPGPKLLPITNHGSDIIEIASISGCNWNGSPAVGTPIGAGQTVWAQFNSPDHRCEVDVQAVDADRQCTMEVDYWDTDEGLELAYLVLWILEELLGGEPNTEKIPDFDDHEPEWTDGDTGTKFYVDLYFDWGIYEWWLETWATPDAIDFRTSDDCVIDRDIAIYKRLDDAERDEAQASLTTFGFDVQAWNSSIEGGADTTSVCAESNTTTSITGASNGVGTPVDVLAGYLDPVKNIIVPCYYGVFEDVPAGWSLVNIGNNGNDQRCYQGKNVELGVGLVSLQRGSDVGPADRDDHEPCEVSFRNLADEVPVIVTKTFVGRTEFTTSDRADFHVWMPNHCSGLSIDPFGNLLGSTGTFRTVNASPDTQFVIGPEGIHPLPSKNLDYNATFDSSGNVVKCTVRVQENHAPAGCTALDYTDSNADGPYWEQSWDVGMTSMEFNIVNDCTEPTPEPTVAPTTAPKKPAAKPGAKKPSGGGSAAPKFTG